MRTQIWRFMDNIESYLCRALLSVFVLILFAQILSRELFGYSISWSEELATYLFVWFVFFGASYAAKMSAHNRVTFQFRFLPRHMIKWIETFSDLIWLTFNGVFIYLSYDFVFHKMNLFWKSQTLGVPMKYIYLVLPIAFSLMSIRIVQVNYYKLVKGIDIKDPDKVEIEPVMGSDDPAQK
ncbi:MAG: TRAP transporter small permease [Sneathiella sp.]